MSVKAEFIDQTTEKTTEVTAAYVDENKWMVCHNLCFFEFRYLRDR